MGTILETEHVPPKTKNSPQPINLDSYSASVKHSASLLASARRLMIEVTSPM